MLVERRSPESLTLEVTIMNALLAADWNGERIAGFIAAQRRDGILRLIVPHHIIEIEMMIWERATAMHVAKQTRIAAAVTSVRRHMMNNENDQD